MCWRGWTSQQPATNGRAATKVRSRHDPSRHHCGFAETVFQGAPVQNLDRSLVCQGNNAAMLQIGNGLAWSRPRRPDNQRCHSGTPANDLPPLSDPRLSSESRKSRPSRPRHAAGNLERPANASETEVPTRGARARTAGRGHLFDPCAGIACKHGILNCRFDRSVPLAVGDEEEVLRQHQIEDLSPAVGTDCAAPGRANNNTIPVARRPRAIGNFLFAMAVHNCGNWIKALETVGLRRKYAPIVICCMAFRFHDRTLSR